MGLKLELLKLTATDKEYFESQGWGEVSRVSLELRLKDLLKTIDAILGE